MQQNASAASSNPTLTTARPGMRIAPSVLYAANFPPLHKAAVASPVHRMPPELICEVFAWTMPCGTGRHGNPKTPWHLGHICRLWRDIAIAYHPLWSTVSLFATGASQMDRLCPPEMIQTLLHRSGNASTSSSESLNQLLQHSHRWTTARVHDWPVELLTSDKGRIPRLQAIGLYSSNGATTDLQNILALAPNLRKVFLANLNYRTPILLARSEDQFPWSQLTHFRGRYPSDERCLTHLKAAPNLVEVGLAVVGWPPTATSHVVLPKLQRLGLISPAAGLLAFVSAPALQQIWKSSDSEEFDALGACIRRSSCQLLKLVGDNVADPSSVIPILQATPTLRALFIKLSVTSPSATELLSALKSKVDPSRTICPNLSHIVIGVRAEFNLAGFLDVLESRWRTNSARPSPLAVVRVFYRTQGAVFDREENLRIGALLTEGLNIEINREAQDFPLSVRCGQ
ncbi:hypothetical protein C8R46DRAFT_1207379 [Mycena filopes]|nr:hypothetical protein C8R46DRAFT_1207379 [Mycena filopes]